MIFLAVLPQMISHPLPRRRLDKDPSHAYSPVQIQTFYFRRRWPSRSSSLTRTCDLQISCAMQKATKNTTYYCSIPHRMPVNVPLQSATLISGRFSPSLSVHHHVVSYTSHRRHGRFSPCVKVYPSFFLFLLAAYATAHGLGEQQEEKEERGNGLWRWRESESLDRTLAITKGRGGEHSCSTEGDLVDSDGPSFVWASNISVKGQMSLLQGERPFQDTTNCIDSYLHFHTFILFQGCGLHSRSLTHTYLNIMRARPIKRSLGRLKTRNKLRQAGEKATIALF